MYWGRQLPHLQLKLLLVDGQRPGVRHVYVLEGHVQVAVVVHKGLVDLDENSTLYNDMTKKLSFM